MDADVVLRRALDAAHHLADPEPPWFEFLDGVRQVVGGDSASFIVVDGQGALLGLAQCRIDPLAEREYVQHFAAHDIVTPATLGAAEGSWFDTQEAFTPEQLGRSAYYVDFMLRHCMPRMLTFIAEQGSLRRAGLSVQRASADGRARRHLESQPVRALTGAVAQALARRRAQAQRWLATVEAALGAFDEAVCVIDRRGVVAQLSASAEAWLGEGAGLRVNQGALWHPLSGVRASLLHTLGRVAVGGQPAQLVVPGSPASGALLLDVARAAGQLRIGSEAILFVRMRRIWKGAEARAEALCAAFDLTAAEGRVLAALANGQSAAEHAEAHGVSVHTVRKQIAVLRSKLGYTRQVDMIRAALAAV